MKIITVANRKGGTGKTTTAYNLGHYKASTGAKVLLIDLDSQGNLTKTCANNFISLEDFMECKVSRVIENLDILPACKNQKKMDEAINDYIVPTSFLEHNLLPKITGYDYVIIDTSPAVSLVNTNSFLISNCILVVVQCDFYSMLGMKDMYEIISQVKRIKPSLEHKIVCNAHFKNRVLNKKIENSLTKLDGFTHIYIPHRQSIKAQIAEGKPSMDVSEYKQLCEVL